jgi:hypothetical protein
MAFLQRRQLFEEPPARLVRQLFGTLLPRCGVLVRHWSDELERLVPLP